MIGSSDTKLKIHARLQPGTTRGSDISRAFLELAGTISTPASSLPLAPAFMPCAVWDPSSGLCLLPPHTVPGLGSLLCLFPLPSLGSQDSGPWPGPQGPAHLVQFFLSPLPVKLPSLHPFPQTSLCLLHRAVWPSLASYSTEKAGLIWKQHPLDCPPPQTNQGPTVPNPSGLRACTLDSLLQLPQPLQLRSTWPLEI